jgi:hypothetical protein
MRALKVFLMVAVVVALVAPASLATAQETNWVKIDCGKIVKVMGNTVVIRLDSTNKTKVFKNVSPDIHFTVNNNEASVYDLKKGMHVCGYREEAAPAPVTVTIEEHEVAAVVDTPDKYDAPPPAPKPAPAPAPAPAPVVLPHTASSLPLAGLAGLMLLGISLGIAILRRF